jgi:hypothetical protein
MAAVRCRGLIREMAMPFRDSPAPAGSVATLRDAVIMQFAPTNAARKRFHFAGFARIDRFERKA